MPEAALLAFRCRGDAPDAAVWADLLQTLHYWPSPARIGIERRLARAGRRVVEHIAVFTDAVAVLDDERPQLEALLRPLREQAALQPAALPAALVLASAILPDVGRVPALASDMLFAELVKELALLPAGAGLSVAVWRAAQEDNDDRRCVRLPSPFPGTELVLRPVKGLQLDAAVRIWSPRTLPPVLLARIGAAFGHTPQPGGTVPARDCDEPVLVSERLARIMAAPGLTPIDRSRAARLGRPHDGALPKEGARLGRVLTPSGALRAFHLPWSLRSRHVFLCGRTGSGKSELIARLAADDLAAGRTLVLVDPHGDLADRVLAHVPEHRHDAVVLIDPADEGSAAIPVLGAGENNKERAAAFDQALVEAIDEGRPVLSGRMRRPVSFALDLLDALPGADPTVVNIDQILADEQVRDGIALALQNELLGRHLRERGRQFWDWGTPRGAMFGHSAGRHAFDHLPRWNLWESLTSGGIVVARLDQAALGTVDAARYGRVLLSLVHQATTGFARIQPEDRPRLSVIVDEAHLFTGSSLLGTMLAQLRKFGAALTICSQAPSRLGSLLPEVLTNCATTLALQLPAAEAGVFRDRGGQRLVDRIAGLPKYHAAMLLDDDADPRPIVLHPEKPLRDDAAARRAALEAAKERHGRRPATAPRGDLERFALLADAAGRRRVPYGHREIEVEPAALEQLVQATLDNQPLPAELD